MSDQQNKGVSNSVSTSRRGFMGGAAAVGATAAIDQGQVGAAVSYSGHTLSADHFDGYVGQSFRVSQSAFEGQGMKLVEVQRLKGTDLPAEARAPFSLLFHASKDVEVPQSTSRFYQSGFGSFEALVVPVGMDGEDRLYEVVYG